jgi:hypothetical protein
MLTNDLTLIIITAPAMGAFLGISASILSRHLPVRELDTSFSPWEFASVDADAIAQWKEVNGDARRDLLKLADKALQACPDVSCDSVADAFGLPRLSVRRLSKGHRGKRVTYYAPEEIYKLAKEIV